MKEREPEGMVHIIAIKAPTLSNDPKQIPIGRFPGPSVEQTIGGGATRDL